MRDEGLSDREKHVPDKFRAVVLHLERLPKGQKELLRSALPEVLRQHPRSNGNQTRLAYSVLALEHRMKVAVSNPLDQVGKLPVATDQQPTTVGASGQRPDRVGIRTKSEV